MKPACSKIWEIQFLNLVMDRLSKEHRSRLMSRVRSKNTTTEMFVRSLIHKLGFRYRLHYKTLPGKPDLAFPSKRKVIFVNGCFWHGHQGCPKGRLPKSNLDVWAPKIQRNQARDAEVQEQLKNSGWIALTVWQCELKDPAELQERVLSFLNA